MKYPKIQFEHPTQLAASTFLRAASENDGADGLSIGARVIGVPINELVTTGAREH